jgi:hypothetical protein
MLALAACSSHNAPTPAASNASTGNPTGAMVSYDELADLQYYQIEGTNTLALELFDGRTTVTDLDCEWETSSPTPVLLVHIFGSKDGPETHKIIWDTEGNAVYYFDLGNVDKSKLRVVYEDAKGRHDIPSAGLLDRKFDVEKPSTSSLAKP